MDAIDGSDRLAVIIRSLVAFACSRRLNAAETANPIWILKKRVFVCKLSANLKMKNEMILENLAGQSREHLKVLKAQPGRLLLIRQPVPPISNQIYRPNSIADLY